jgi:hypothetical protein
LYVGLRKAGNIYLRMRSAEEDEQSLGSGKGDTVGIWFMQWDQDLAMREEIVVLRGEGCAATVLSRALSEWNL